MATYGAPGKNPYTIPGVGGVLSNVVDSTTGITQIYRQGPLGSYQSLGTYNPSTGKFTPFESTTATETRSLANQTINIRNASVKTATNAGATQIQAQNLMIQNSESQNESSNNDGTVSEINLQQITPGKKNPNFSDAFGKDTLVYPTNIRGNGQDYIKFTVIRYIPRKIDTSNNQPIGVLDRDTTKKETLGNIILPIQPSITDNNSVDWNGLGINPLAMEAANGSINLMSGSGAQYVEGLVQRLGNTVDDNTKNAIKLYFAQKAAGVNGLLSRVSGAIVNPNMELLFQGPTLRPFNFNFRLSPRDNPEAKEVKQIIRSFKQYSSAGISENKMFITTPNVFEIEYKSGEDSHKSLNKIKSCALTSVSVDYTPDGSYMTFNDAESGYPMTSYSLSLQFQELEPVTTNDYDINYDEIGY